MLDHRVHSKHGQMQGSCTIHRRARCCYLLQHHDGFLHALAGSTIGFRNRDTNPPCLGHGIIKLLRVLPFAILPFPVLIGKIPAHIADRLANQLQVNRLRKIHGSFIPVLNNGTDSP